MTKLRIFCSRIATIFRRTEVEADLEQEIRSHIEMQQEDHFRNGMSREQAHQMALKDFGRIESVKEQYRDRYSFPTVESMLQDVGFGLRTLRLNPGFAATAVLTLAIGIGANTAAFSIVNAVLLQPLPYKDSDRIVRIIQHRSPQLALMDGLPLSMAAISTDDLREWRNHTETFSELAAYVPRQWTFFNDSGSVRVSGALISPSMFSLLQVEPLIGRAFETREESVGTAPVVILSFSAWQKYFAGDRGALGRTANIEGRGYSVVGIMPRGFEFPTRETEFWMPLILNPVDQSVARGIVLVSAIARLKDGVSLTKATAEANLTFGQLHKDLNSTSGGFAIPGNSQLTLGALARIELVTIKDQLVAPVRPALFALLVAVGFVLLIACANVANLLLARATARQTEIAIRTSLGASTTRLVRQLLTESVTLALLAGILGILLAAVGLRILPVFGSEYIPRLEGVGMDRWVLVFTLVASVATGILFGLMPALQVRRGDPMHKLKEARMLGSGTRLLGRNKARNVLAIGEIALAMVLLVGAGLLTNSFLRLVNIDRGYDARNLLTFRMEFPQSRYSAAQAEAFSRGLVERLEGLPQVQFAAMSSSWPELQQSPFMEGPISIQGRPRQEAARAGVRVVDQNYIGTLGMRLLEGRSFEDIDRDGQPPVVVINKALAQSYFQNRSAIGERVQLFNAATAGVVGVVDNVQYLGFDGDSKPEVYVNIRQAPALLPPIPAAPPPQSGAPADLPVLLPGLGADALFGVRSAGDPLATAGLIRGIVHEMDPQLIVDDMATMEQRLAVHTARPRFYTALGAIFSIIATTLAAIGVYGLMAYSVSQRTREIGIRMALGSHRHEVLWLILQQGLALTGVGVVIGILGSLLLTRHLNDLLFQLTPTDPATFIVVIAIIVLAASLACYIPARRAAKVDPAISLRYE